MVRKLRTARALASMMLIRLLSRTKARTAIRWHRLRGSSPSVIVGASSTARRGWITTEQEFFDVTSSDSILEFLRSVKLSRLLAEHVLEHLSPEEVSLFFRNIRPSMAAHGRIRVAVPDANHPSPWYRRNMGVNGEDPGADDHKSFWSVASLTSVAEREGFRCVPLEYFDSVGRFHHSPYDEMDGYISRSLRRYDGRLTTDSVLKAELFKGVDESSRAQMMELGLTYSSLIIDFFKSDG